MSPLKLDDDARICFVIPTVPPDFSGGGILAYNLAGYLARIGTHITVLTKTATPRTLEGVVFETISDIGGPLGSKSRRLLTYTTLLPRARAALLQAKPSVIHIMSCDAWTLIFALAAQILEIPVLLETSLAGADDPLFIKKSRFGAAKFEILNTMDALVSVSPLLDDLAAEAGLPPYRRRIVPNQVEIRKFSETIPKAEAKRKLGLDDFDPILLNVAIIRPRKGIKVMIDSFSHHAKTRPDLGLVLVGPTDKDAENRRYTNEMKRYAASLGIGDRVVFTGLVDNVEEYMAASDLFIFASEQEGFGTVIVEAMASGLPVLVKRIPRISSYIINHGENGMIADSEREFVTYLGELLQNSELRKRLARAGRTNAESRFSEEVIAAEYIEIYRDIGASV